jgi:CHAD domain-containing protein
VDRSYLVLAAKYIRRQVKQLAEQSKGIDSADDIEFVHRSRVASRRLRAALKMFAPCFRGKAVKRWQKEIRRVTRQLGHARDKDVQIAHLSAALAGRSEAVVCRGVSRLLVRCESERAGVQPHVRKAIKRLKRSDVLDEMQSATQRILRKVNADSVHLGSEFACAETSRHIREQLDELLTYQDSLNDVEDEQRHHAMRIAAKRLRYTLEIANPVYEKRLGPMIDAVKQVQTLLGEIHDCDVWQEHIDAFADEERAYIAECYGNERPFAHLEPGIAWLREDRRAHRRQTFAQLVDTWAELRRQRVWDRLAQVLERCEEPGGPHVPGRPVSLAERWARTLAVRMPEPVLPPARARTEPVEESRRPHQPPHSPAREMLSR